MSIHILPPDIVDRIAAGEVIQRPSNAIKEVVENSLDAGASSITVTMESADSWSIVDNGHGIGLDDLPLAATRHATSKLTSTSDFDSLASFGFRGEALASISMCAHLTITSKVVGARVAYKQLYKNGAPATNESAQPCARPQGTTIRIDNLFYNLPHRRKANSGSDAYNQVLNVLQSYAILVARDGISVVCQKKARSNTKIDLNSAAAVMHCSSSSSKDATKKQQALATKHVLQQVYGSQMTPHSCEFESRMIASTASDPIEDGGADVVSVRADKCTYSCQGFVTSPSYIQNKKTIFILFCNNRLVECNPLKRAMEAVYADYSKGKPLIYWSIQVPPDQVDVNVHPTKRQVTLLHLDTISSHLQQALRAFLQSQGQSFESQSVLQSQLQQQQQLKRKRDKEEKENEERNVVMTTSVQTQLKYSQQLPPSNQSTAVKLPPSKLIRTSRSSQHGSIEPFVMSSQTQSVTTQFQARNQTSSQSSEESLQAGTLKASSLASTGLQHLPGCPLLSTSPLGSVELSEPGAFAKVASLCTCRSTARDQPVVLVPPQHQATIGQQQSRKIQPSECQLKSIVSLRRRVIDQAADPTMVAQLRSSCLVGVISQTRCLLQCGADLVLLNYYDCACELFYQLALLQFGSVSIGHIAVPVSVVDVIAQFVELEDKLLLDEDCEDISTKLFDVSETNQSVATQAASFLNEKAGLLREYFSIIVETDASGTILLTGLPVLLQSHSPSPHGVALFLLRLATEVDYTKEKRCFQGICRELGLFYASVAATNESGWHSLVRHCLFPAITTHLIPSETVQEASIKTVGNLSQLYRVFERC